jgi:hypothetical protein
MSDNSNIERVGSAEVVEPNSFLILYLSVNRQQEDDYEKY